MYIVEMQYNEGEFSFHFCEGNNKFYEFTFDMEAIDNLIEFLFENTDGRFIFLGTNRLYFEKEEDAMVLKLAYDEFHNIKIKKHTGSGLP